jgi:L-fuconolactonase
VADNDWILELAARDPYIVGLVGHLKPSSAGFAADLERYARNRLFRGFRTGGWNIPLTPENSAFLRDIRSLAARGLCLDVVGGPDQLPKVERLATLVPDLKIVVNHCAGVRITGSAPDPAWVADIQRVAAHPNVAMKVSGLAEATGKQFSAPRETEFYEPVLDVLWNAFGEERLIFGSNWPVSERFTDYAGVLGIVQPYFRGRGATAEARYFSENARRIYGV